MKLEILESRKIVGAKIELGTDSLKILRILLHGLHSPNQELLDLRAELERLWLRSLI